MLAIGFLFGVVFQSAHVVENAEFAEVGSRPRYQRHEHIIEERAILESALKEFGITYFPSEANFVTCALLSGPLRDALAPEGLSVRDGAGLGLPGWTRITIGWAPQMAVFRDVLCHHVEARQYDWTP